MPPATLATRVTLRELADLAIGTPEVGAVNFTALHTLLVAVLRNLNFQDTLIDFQLPSPEGGRSVESLRTLDSAQAPREKHKPGGRLSSQALESQVKDLGSQVHDLTRRFRKVDSKVQSIATQVQQQQRTSQADGLHLRGLEVAIEDSTTSSSEKVQRRSSEVLKDTRRVHPSSAAQDLPQGGMEDVEILKEAYQKAQDLKLEEVLQRVAELERQMLVRDNFLGQVSEKLMYGPNGEEVTMVTWEDLEQAITDGWKASQGGSESMTGLPRHRTQPSLTSDLTPSKHLSIDHTLDAGSGPVPISMGQLGMQPPQMDGQGLRPPSMAWAHNRDCFQLYQINMVCYCPLQCKLVPINKVLCSPVWKHLPLYSLAQCNQRGLVQPGADQRGLVQPGIDQSGLVQPGADQRGLVQPGVDQRGLVQPGVDQHGLVQPGVGQRGLVQPGADQRGLVQPGVDQRGLVQPGVDQHGLVQPGVGQRGLVQPGADQRGLVQPGVDQRGLVQPGVDQHGLVQPGVDQQGLVQPGIDQHGLVQPGVDQRGLVQPGIDQRGLVQPGVDQHGLVQPGVGQRGLVQPGVDQRSLVQPGADQRGLVQPGADQHGSVQPGVDQHGLVQPGVDQQGLVQPGIDQRGLVQPGADQRGLVQPGVDQHGLVQPGVDQRGLVQPGVDQRGLVQPGVDQRSLVQPGADQRGLVQPGADQRGLVQPGVDQRGLVQPGVDQRGFVQPGVDQRGLVQPGIDQRGLVQPGVDQQDQRGLVQPGADQHGSVQPGVDQHGLVQPGVDQQGLVQPDQYHHGPVAPGYGSPGYTGVDPPAWGLASDPNRTLPAQTTQGRDVFYARSQGSLGSSRGVSSDQSKDRAEAQREQARQDSLEKLAPNFPLALETFFLLGEMVGLYVKLKEDMGCLEEEVGQSDLERIQYLIAAMVKKTLPPDLQEQLKAVKTLTKEVRQEKAKLDKMQRVLEGDDGQGIGKELKASQLGLQLGTLRVTVADIEKELAELRDSQEQGKAAMENSVAEASLYLQDQLDKLRTIIESMLASSSTLLSLSMAPYKPMTNLEPGQIDPEATCPACSLDLSHQVSMLVRRYEQLQDMVNNLAASRPSKKAKLQSQDEELLGHVQSAILQVQGDCEKLNITTSNLIQDHQRKQQDINVLYQGLEKLEKEKANRENLEMEIDVKADKSALEGKVSRVQFDATTEQLNHMMQELMAKMSGQEQDWQKMLDKLLAEMDSKLDRLELDPVKQMLEDRWKSLRQQLRERSPRYQSDEAAALRKQLLAHFHCLSCDRPLETPVTGQIIPVTPVVQGLPGHRSTRPYTVFELEQVRQQSRSLRLGSTISRSDLSPMDQSVRRLRTMHSKMLMDIEKVQMHFGGSVSASSQMIRELLQAQCLGSPCYRRTADGTDFTYSSLPRRCGGSHTLTYPYRRSRLQHVTPSPEDIRIAMKRNEVDLLGLDGHIYKGRVDMRLPGTLTKDGMTKHKPKQSRPHRPRQQPLSDPSRLPARSQSAQILAAKNSASLQQQKGRPVSYEGLPSQSSLARPSSPARMDSLQGSSTGLSAPRDVPPGEGFEEPTRGPRSTRLSEHS
ncbi:glutamine-rich protein 2 [Ctenodactylus gundi]